MFHGARPHLKDASQRRAVNTDALFAAAFPYWAKLEEDLINQGGRWVDDYFTSSRGLKLGTRTFIPANFSSSRQKAGVIVCHGYTDNLRWMQKQVFIKYAQRGFLVTGMEVEGHGFSDGTSALIKDINLAVKDLDEFVAFQREHYKKEVHSWIVHGESMGGMFAIMEVLNMQQLKGEIGEQESDPKENVGDLKGMVLVAPMCKISEDIKPPKMISDLLIFISRYLPSLSVVPSTLDDSLIFKDPEVAKLAGMDPVKYVGKPRMATAATLMASTEALESRLAELKTPFFVIHGKKDRATTFEASVELYERCSVAEKDKKLYLVEDAWHGVIFGEPKEKMEEYWNEMLNWAEARVSM